jgi:hypothetical protein
MSEMNCVIDSIFIVLDILPTVPAMKSYGRKVLVFNIEVASDRTIRLRGVLCETRTTRLQRSSFGGGREHMGIC